MLTRPSISSSFLHPAKSMLPQKHTLPSQQQQQQHQPFYDQSSSSFNLEKVVRQYAAQPDLLELILSSKVEEDRRRAEEAKLKRKEIDYVLQQQYQQKQDDDDRDIRRKQQQPSTLSDHSQRKRLPSLLPISPSLRPTSSLSTSSSSTSSSSSSPPPYTLQPNPSSAPDYGHQKQHRSSHSISWRSSSIILPPLTASSPPPSSSSSSSSPSPLLSSSSFSPKLGSDALHSDTPLKPSHPSPKRPSESSSLSSDTNPTPYHNVVSHPPQAPLSPPNEKSTADTTGAPSKRRRREMQAITTIIETKEFPYNDDYLWRNNGNTTHKKTGNKSIYYKCANSQQGCPVNKTCTLRQDTGEYLIKYRGIHLSDCSTIKRINEV